jgi:hypothetical protein
MNNYRTGSGDRPRPCPGKAAPVPPPAGAAQIPAARGEPVSDER